MDTSYDSGTATFFLLLLFLIEPMTEDVESTTTTQWGGVKQGRGQVAFSCGMPGADLERFPVLS